MFMITLTIANSNLIRALKRSELLNVVGYIGYMVRSTRIRVSIGSLGWLHNGNMNLGYRS